MTSIREVSITTNGKRLTGWTTVMVRKSIDQFADEYDFELSSDRINLAGYKPSLSDVEDAFEEVNQDDAIEIRVDDELVLTGYVDNIDLAYDGESASLRIGGLSKTGDLVDSSAIYQTGLWKEAYVSDIVRDICQPFGIDVVTIGDLGKTFNRFKLSPGEKCYEAISRAISMRQFLATSEPDGSMTLSKVRQAYGGARLELGVNILSASINRNRRDIHNRYIFKGQTAASDDWNGKSASQLDGAIEDSGVKRYRPLVILGRKQRSREDLGKRALWERNVRAGRGERFRYVTDDWLDNTGTLWSTNSLIQCKDSFIKLDDQMLSSTVEFRLNGDQLTAMIEVVPPYTYDVLDSKTFRGTKIG